jgi:hypothetical protein
MPGGVRGYGDYIYGYNFAQVPTDFSGDLEDWEWIEVTD